MKFILRKKVKHTVMVIITFTTSIFLVLIAADMTFKNSFRKVLMVLLPE
jgi:hypothetical protein